MSGGTKDWGESFTIDPWGNLTAETVTKCSAEALTTSATTRNQLAASTYDSAGNAITNLGMAYSYDAEGRIVSAGGTAYTYDGTSERVSKPGNLYWKGTGSNALAETSATNTNPTRYIFFGGKRIARLDPGATTPKYYVSDNVGSTALVTDYLGNALSESLFYPYGVEQVILSGDTNTYKFTGKQRDPESGLDNFGARYYASNLGRFMSPDWDAKPVTVPYASFGDPQTLNLYAYVENGPLNRVDANGHQATPLENFWSVGVTTCLGTEGCADLQEAAVLDPIGDAEVGMPFQIQAESAAADATAQAASASAATQAAQAQATSSSSGMTTTITHADGTVEVRTGTAAFRNNNPGNIRPGDFADDNGAIGIDPAPKPGHGPWAVFENSDDGKAALGALLDTASVGKRTIQAEMQRYASSKGDNPAGYAGTIAGKLGVPVTTKMSALSPAQKAIVAQTITTQEGSSGTVRIH